MSESRSCKDICEHFSLVSLLHSSMWLVWLELSADRPNTTNIHIYSLWEGSRGDRDSDSVGIVRDSAKRDQRVSLNNKGVSCSLLRSLCSAWSILHWANFILPLWVSHLEVEVAGLFHAYWAISSYGLCFCRCFLTGFDRKCSLPWKMIFFYLCLSLKLFSCG